MAVGRLLVVPIGGKLRSMFRSAARLGHRVVVVSGGTTFSRLVVTVVRLLLVPVGGEVRPLGSFSTLPRTTFSRWLWFTCLSTWLACCVVNLFVMCRLELVRMDVAGCSTALGRRSVAGVLVAARPSVCVRSVGLPLSPSGVAYRSVGRNENFVSTEPSAL